VGLLLTDARGQVVDRRAADTGILTRLDRIGLAPGFLYGEGLIGTNAIGTAIAQQAPSVVAGTEHFADALTSMACAATPVTGAAGQLLGVIDLTCAAEHFSSTVPCSTVRRNRPDAGLIRPLHAFGCQQSRSRPGPTRVPRAPR
jgi:transcriptional regulator of acetoin/glycerol metabolism